MKFTAAVSALVFGAVAVADIQSKPFKLVLSSSDKSVDGKQIASCHSGAAIETLCVANKGDEYRHNKTEGSQSPLDGYNAAGVLTWELPSQPQPVSEAMTFYQDPGTNVALPLFEPSYDSQQVAFSQKDGKMVVIGYYDDTKNTPSTDKAIVLNNWYVCQTKYASYQYQTLAWVSGSSKAKPQNPSCIKVDVTKKF